MSLKYKTMHQELSITIPNTSTITVKDQATLAQATSLLSSLNTSLDQLTAHKEAKTRPINEALKKIRDDYRPLEQQLTEAIATIRQSITKYAQEQAKIAIEREQKILDDKRLTTTTKIARLAELEQVAPQKVETTEGSITFTTTKKYQVSNPVTGEALANLWRANILVLDVTALKAHIKTTANIPAGIEITEEQTLRNYRP